MSDVIRSWKQAMGIAIGRLHDRSVLFRSLVAVIAIFGTSGMIAGCASGPQASGTPHSPSSNSQSGTSGNSGAPVVYIAVTSDTNPYYADTGPDSVIPINSSTGALGRPIPIPGKGIAGIATTPDGRAVYVLIQGGLVRVSLDTGSVGAPVRSGGSGVAVSPDGQIAYVTDGSHEITPVKLSSGARGQTVTVQNPGFGLSGIAIAPDARTAYVVTYNNNGNATNSGIIPVDLTTRRAGTPIVVPGSGGPYGGGLFDIALTPNGETAYVTGRSTDSTETTPGAGGLFVESVNLSTRKIGKPIALPFVLGDIAITPDGSTAYVAGSSIAASGQISGAAVIRIHLATGSVDPPISLPGVAVTGIAIGAGPLG